MLDIENQLHQYAEAVETAYRPPGVADAAPTHTQRNHRRPVGLLIGAGGLVVVVVVLIAARTAERAPTEVTDAASDPAVSEPLPDESAAGPAFAEMIPPGSVAISLNYPPNPDAPASLDVGDVIAIRGSRPGGGVELAAEVLAFSSETLTIIVPNEAAQLLSDIDLSTVQIELLAQYERAPKAEPPPPGPIDSPAAEISPMQGIPEFEVDADGVSFGRMPNNGGGLLEELLESAPDYIAVLGDRGKFFAGYVETRLMFDPEGFMALEPFPVIDRERNLVGHWYQNGGFVALDEPPP